VQGGLEGGPGDDGGRPGLRMGGVGGVNGEVPWQWGLSIVAEYKI
jgi:hypothetical protein